MTLADEFADDFLLASEVEFVEEFIEGFLFINDPALLKNL
jgi:hypothetical protein